jgi:hypothetical protein
MMGLQREATKTQADRRDLPGTQRGTSTAADPHQVEEWDPYRDRGLVPAQRINEPEFVLAHGGGFRR